MASRLGFETMEFLKEIPWRLSQDAGFIGVDEIRMLLEKIFTLILHFNLYTHIILVFKFI